MTETDELLPCPFCGGRAKDAHLSGSAWFIDAEHAPDCHLADFQRSEAEAIAAWNRRADTAALAVKALEWIARGTWRQAHTSIGHYIVEDNGSNWTHDRYWLHDPERVITKVASLETAQATAQADFERRIRSALSSPLASTAGAEGWRAGLEAAAKLIEDNQQTFSSSATGNRRGLSPRIHGNLDGLAFAEAIRALASPAVSSASQAEGEAR